jgi:hypothetical protein
MIGKLTTQSAGVSRILVVVLLATMLLPGCSFGNMPTIEPTIDTGPTFEVVKTESAKTVVAELTKSAGASLDQPTATLVAITATEGPADTATPAPTNTLAATPIPSFTPVTPTMTFTRTLPPPPPAATPTPLNTGCTITSQSPAAGADFDKNGDFDGNWVVRNEASTTWSASSVDFKYISGTKFQTNVDSIDLPADVAKNGTINLIIDMRAPGVAGRYYTTWALVDGSTRLCTVSLTIDVNN